MWKTHGFFASEKIIYVSHIYRIYLYRRRYSSGGEARHPSYVQDQGQIAATQQYWRDTSHKTRLDLGCSLDLPGYLKEIQGNFI